MTPMMAAKNMVGVSAPLGFFDPLGFAAKADAKTLAKYRESELKHGRVAMLAVLGYLAAENWHPLYDGKLSGNPLKALWEMPPAGAVQIIAFCGLLEYTFDAVQKAGGNAAGDIYGISGRISDKDAPAWVDFQTRELNNGRLAMMAIMGEFAHTGITGEGAIAGTMSTKGHYGLWYLSQAAGFNDYGAGLSAGEIYFFPSF
jgi:Chlorophyll A-B binding protein